MPKDTPKKPTPKKVAQSKKWTEKYFDKIQSGGKAGRQTQKVLDDLNKKGY